MTVCTCIKVWSHWVCLFVLQLYSEFIDPSIVFLAPSREPDIREMFN